MSEPYVGEIRLVPYNFAPQGWMFCNGSILSISQFEVLFVLIGTTYGGDGVNTFAIPDLRGRVPIHMGPGFVQGQLGGTESASLTSGQIPSHSHVARCDNTIGANQLTPNGAYWSFDNSGQFGNYAAAPTSDSMAAGAISNSGNGQAHENRQPYLALSYIISLFGVFPTQN